MNVLVIGGTGLISGATVRQLKKDSHKVSIFHRGRRPLELRGVREILGDRQDRKDFEAKMSGERFDAVIDSILFNAEDAQSALRAFEGRTKHFLFISTVCAVGGPLTRIPADEEEPYQPLSPYGRGKAEAERLLLQAHRKRGFPVTVFRPSHTYGPGAGIALGTFVCNWESDPGLMLRILQGKPVIVHGDGEGLWQSCLATEVAEGLVGALQRKLTIGQIYNLCGHEVVTWNEYYRRLGLALGRSPKIVHLPSDLILAQAPSEACAFLRDIGQYHGAYSIQKALKEIPGFRPRTPLEKGLRMQYAWMKKKGLLASAPKRPFEDHLAKEALAWLRAKASGGKR